MFYSIIKLILGSGIIISAISCTSDQKNVKHSRKVEIRKDTCQLNLGKAQIIELGVGCGNSHTYDEKRHYHKLPTYAEISAMDSLKLSEFIFKTRHKGYFLTDTMLINHNNKALDTMNVCEKRKLNVFH